MNGNHLQNSSDIVKEFAAVKVLIVGDLMLDQYWWGTVDRISPEAPVPVVKLDQVTLAAGGAANVAANVSGLGAEPLLIGMIGNDSDSQLLHRSPRFSKHCRGSFGSKRTANIYQDKNCRP